MNMTGMAMNGSGGISGVWINKKTNKVVTVRDCIFEDERMLVQTVEGLQLDGADFTENYYQVSEDNKDANAILKQVTTKPPVDPMFEGLEDLINETSQDQAPKTPKAPVAPAKKYNQILVKLFKDMPMSCKALMDFSSVPKEALRMAKQYLDVSDSEIVEYIMSNVKIDKADLERQINEFLES